MVSLGDKLDESESTDTDYSNDEKLKTTKVDKSTKNFGK